MTTTFTICWIRLNPSSTFFTDKSFIQKYCNHNSPKPLQLEGNGIQYVCAFNTIELNDILSKIKEDGHESNLMSYSYIIDSNPEDYEVSMQYCKEPIYFLNTIYK